MAGIVAATAAAWRLQQRCRHLLAAAQHHVLHQNHQQQLHHHLHTYQQQQHHHHQHQHRALHLTSAAATPSLDSRGLADIVKLDLLQGKSADEVEAIWSEHHASSERFVGSVLGREEHLVLCARAAASPLFVLPVAKGGGGRFQTMLLQWQPPHALLVTLLEEYKAQGPAAPPRLAVRFYSELAEDTGLVLARGEVLSPHVVSAAEGRTLLELARAFYRDSSAYQAGPWAFNHRPDSFDFQQLCSELGIASGSGAGADAGGPSATAAAAGSGGGHGQ